jgi:hypothetical protein
MMRYATLLLLLFANACVYGQIKPTPAIQGPWVLESINRNSGSIVFYNRAADQAAGYPPVYWLISDNKLAITGNLGVPAIDPKAQDTVEAHQYTISGDTLILNRYYTQDLELATVTNSTQAYYKIEEAAPTTLVLVLYDRLVTGGFRPIDKYSRRYVFRK